MADTIAPAATIGVRARDLAGRLVGVLTAPRATYAVVAARPAWLGALSGVLLITMGASTAFFATEIGQQALVDQQIRTMESFGRPVSDAQYQALQAIAPYAVSLTVLGQLISLPLAALAISGIAFAILGAALGAAASFKQVFAVVSHSGTIIALQQCLTLPLDYARETLSSPTNLGAFLPFLDENTFLARLVGSIDLFVVWWALSVSIGLGVLCKRSTAPIAAGLLVVYVMIALALAAIRTVLSGSSGV